MGQLRPRSVAKADSRVSLTINSDAHRYLLDKWAQLTGRSPANLASFLLEKAITDALRNGDAPSEAVKAMNQLIEALGERKADEHQGILDLAKTHGSYIDW